MSRKRHTPDQAPDREAILSYVAEELSHGRHAGVREVSRAFGIAPGHRLWLKRLLRETEEPPAPSAAGKTAGGGQTGGSTARLPEVLAVEIVATDDDGELIGEPLDWTDAGPRPRFLILQGQHHRTGAANVGDRALVKQVDLHPPGPLPAARILKRLEKQRPDLVGVFRSGPRGGRIAPIDKKAAGRDLMVPAGWEGDAKDGDLVAASLIRAHGFGLPKARVRRVLGEITSETSVSLIAIHNQDIPHIFPETVLHEAEATQAAGFEEREDWRDLPLITIDPVDAKDHDDAVHATPDADPANTGGFIVTVAIADVAAYVLPGSALDREALKRGNSVYFPDRVVPMLPERLSNDLCSLKPGVDRPALAVRLVLRADGTVRRHSFHRIMMRSQAKLAYEQAQAAIDGRPDATTAPILEPILRPLWAAYACAGKARDDRGPLHLDLPERKLKLDQRGHVVAVVTPERLDAHRLIEEFMILANVAAAETLEAARTPLIYRVHDEPTVEKMRALAEILLPLGIKLPKQGALSPSLFNTLLDRFKDGQHELFVNEMVLRSQAQAVYAPANLGHFGLSLRRYAHFTSPIRRYADLVVHRGLIRALGLTQGALPKATDNAALAQVSEHISACERRAMAAERETVDRLIAYFLADRIGATFTGRIAGLNRAGLFVRLAETGADGFVPLGSMNRDYYAFDETQMALIGRRTGESFRLGDVVEVRLEEAVPLAGALRFELLSEGRYVEPTDRRGKRSGRRLAGHAPAPRPGPKKGYRRK